MVSNRNQLAKATREDILFRLCSNQNVDRNYKPFGDGNSALKMVRAIEKWWEENRK